MVCTRQADSKSILDTEDLAPEPEEHSLVDEKYTADVCRDEQKIRY